MIFLSISTSCCNSYNIEDVTKTTNDKPNNNFESSPSLNQFRFSFRNCDILLPQDQTGYIYFLISQNDTYYFHIVSTLCLRNTLKKYNVGGYASGTDIAMYLILFVFYCLHLWFGNWHP